MNLRQIEVFRAVMATASTTDAAKLLHVSQPGVSRLIRHLELRLGVDLFLRRKGRLVATPEAHVLHNEIEHVYRGVQHVQDVAARLRFGGQASLRVLASANVGLQLVPRAVAVLGQRFPQSMVYFETLPTREIVKLLVTEEADVAVVSAAPDHPSLEAREIGHWSIVAALPRTHPLARSKTLPLDEALRQRLVVYNPEAPQSRVIDAWLGQRGIDRRAAVEVRSGYAACSMAAAGAGVAFVDDLSARAHRSEDVVFFPVPRAPRFPLYTIVNANRPPSQLGKALAGLVKSCLAELQKEPITRA